MDEETITMSLPGADYYCSDCDNGLVIKFEEDEDFMPPSQTYCPRCREVVCKVFGTDRLVESEVPL